MINHLSTPASLMPKYPTLPNPTSSKDPNLYLSVDCSASIAGLKANNLRVQDVMRPLYACLITAYSAEHGSSVIKADRRRPASSSVQMFIFGLGLLGLLGAYLKAEYCLTVSASLEQTLLRTHFTSFPDSPLLFTASPEHYPRISESWLQRQTSREGLKDLRLDEAIRAAIKQGWPDTVKELLSQPRSTPKPPPPEDQSPNPEADDDSNSETALMLAYRLGHSDIVEILLGWMSQCSSQDQLGELPGSWTDTAAVDSEGNTALHLAATEGHDQVVEILLQNNRDLLEKTNEKEKNRSTVGLRGWQILCFQLLLESGASPKIKNTLNQDTVLHLAACGGNLECFEGLYKRLPGYLNEKNGYGARPLHLACQFGNASIVSFLLDKDADPRVKDDDNEDTPLHLAVSANKIDVVEILVKRDKELLNLKNAKGETALLVAGSGSLIEVVNYLLENEADIYSVDSAGENILHNAVRESRIDLVEVLLERNMEIRPSHTGRTPLHHACFNNKDELVSKFLDHLNKDSSKKRKTLSHKDNWGDSPLSDAASDRNVHIVLQFLKDPVYFSQDSLNYLATDKIWFSDERECEKVNELLISKLESLKPRSENGSDVSSQSTSGASEYETMIIDKSLTQICYWAILNQRLGLMKACVERAEALNYNLTLQKESPTWLHVFAIGCDGDPKDPFNHIPLGLVPRDSRGGLDPDHQGVTPLHIAVKHARVEMVKSFLSPTPSTAANLLKGILQQTLDERKETTISLATAGEKPEHREITKLLWQEIKRYTKMIEPSKGDLDEQIALALELAARFEPPREEVQLKALFDQIEHNNNIETDILSLAIYHKLPKVVWWLLSNGAYINERNIKNGNSMLDTLSKNSADDKRCQAIKALLGNPPPLNKSGTRGGDSLLPEIESSPDDYKDFPQGTIVDFSHAEGSTEITFQLKRRPLTEIIHKSGPRSIMDSGDVSYDVFFRSTEDATADGNEPEIPMAKRSHLGDQRKKQYHNRTPSTSSAVPQKKLVSAECWWEEVHEATVPGTVLTSTTDELDEDAKTGEKDGFLQCVLDSFQAQTRDLELSTDGIVELIVATAIGLFQRKDITVAPKDHKRSPLDVFHEAMVEIVRTVLVDEDSQRI
ncbi:uncharacterized protein N7506_009192 [Penicillium brevicompactum]|uniref:uncharacterized protein n=1 Tax=Penicillium brevicompactum TaxID=5074 RepID=UPI0025418737|nr:uncharacterized protein N7506_009192 [Penicillium brevicompactum]KAJ5326090.1 hypothetical protein N7506_009192 [Penicillium brevicompactum]